jgi:hypothetical protein
VHVGGAGFLRTAGVVRVAAVRVAVTARVAATAALTTARRQGDREETDADQAC